MYSPQQNLPSYVKTQPREAGFPWRLLILTGVLLILMVLVYAGMSFGYHPYLQSQLSAVEDQLNGVSSSLQADESDVFDVYSQLYNIQSLSKSHIYGSKIFTILEKGTVPLARLTKASVDIKKNSILVEGGAPNHDVVVSQVAAFGNIAGVSEAHLLSTALQEDSSVHFSIDLVVEKGYFQQP